MDTGEMLDLFRPLVSLAVRRIVETEDFDAFVRGFASDLGDAAAAGPATELSADDPVDPSALAHVLGRAIWNVTPLPSNDWRPRPVPVPGRNDICPCGSGRKFKNCCAKFPSPTGLTTQFVWPFVLAECSPEQVRTLVERNRVSVPAVCDAALELNAEGRERDAIDVLEALLEGDAASLPASRHLAIQPMAFLLTEAQREEDRDVLLERLVAHGAPAIRTEALLAQSSVHAGHGEWDAASGLVREAQSISPDSPTAAEAELRLLVEQDRFEDAMARARELHRHFSRVRDAPEGLLEYLEDMAVDPRLALLHAEITDPEIPVTRILGCVDRIVERTPQAAYRVVEMHDDELRFGEDDDEIFGVRDGERPITLSCNALADVESRWHRLAGIEKSPFADLEAPGVEQALEHPDPWLGFLERTPQAGDSLDILEDLCAILIAIEPPEFGRAVGRFLVLPLLDHAWRIAGAAMAAAPEGASLPTFNEANAGLLRMGSERVNLLLRGGDTPAGVQVARTMLQWNPDDEHEVRDVVLLAALEAGRWDEVGELVSDYDGDDRAVMSFGYALALFGQGRRAAADHQLAIAMRTNEFVARVLVLDEAPQPDDMPDTDDAAQSADFEEALDYHDQARDIWEGVPGALEWLAAAERASHRRTDPRGRGGRRR